MKLIPFREWLFRIQQRKKVTEGQAKQIACKTFGIGQNTCYVYYRDNSAYVIVDRRNKSMRLMREVRKCDYVL